MKKYILYAVLIPLMALLTSCKDDPTTLTFSVDNTDISAPANGSYAGFVVHTMDPWTVSKPADASWVTFVSNSSGKSSAKVVVKVELNPTTNPRTTTLVVSADGQTENVVISQAANVLPDAAGSISGTDVNTCPDLSIELSVATIKNATSYVWYKDGVTDSITTLPTYVIKQSGSYTVAGMNVVGKGTVSSPKNVTISACLPPTGGAISGDGYNTCPAVTIALTTTIISNTTSYVWYKDGVEITTTTTPSYTATESGSYTVAGRNDGGTGPQGPAKSILISTCGASFADDMVGTWDVTETLYTYSGSWVSAANTHTLSIAKINGEMVKITGLIETGKSPIIAQVTGSAGTGTITIPAQELTEKPSWLASDTRQIWMVPMTTNSFSTGWGQSFVNPITTESGKLTIDLRGGYSTMSYGIVFYTPPTIPTGGNSYAIGTKWVKQ